MTQQSAMQQTQGELGKPRTPKLIAASDRLFYAALVIIGASYVLLIVAMLLADGVYMVDQTVKVPAKAQAAADAAAVEQHEAENASVAKRQQADDAKRKLDDLNGKPVESAETRLAVAAKAVEDVTTANTDVDKALADAKAATSQAQQTYRVAERMALEAEAAAKLTNDDTGKSADEKKRAADVAAAIRQMAGEAKNALNQAQQKEKPAQDRASNAAQELAKALADKKSAEEALAKANRLVAAATVKYESAEAAARVAESTARAAGEKARAAQADADSRRGWLAFVAENPMVVALADRKIQYSIWLSMISCTLSAILSVVVAVPLGYLMSRHRFFGQRLLDAIVDIPIVLPPLVVGLSLLILFQFPPFSAIARSVVYQVPAVILAQFSVACAFAVRTMKHTFDHINPRYEQVALSLGCSRVGAFGWVVLPEASRGMTTAFTLAWARSLGEFGPLLIFAGTTRMKTEVLSVSVYLEMNVGNVEAAVAVSLVMVAAAVAVLILARLYGSRDIGL